ncbi:hypothetical protein [Flavobacterium mesophilum]|uniref:hypothetical protein n=1 Tax=Flavobacterium mesophilum TaxID=3143495 RepID=UPI0031E02431
MKDDEPHALTVWALGFGEGFFTSVIMDMLLIRFLGVRMNKWLMIGISILFLLFNYFYFFKSGRGKKIVISKPMFFNNERISIIVTIIFFVILISSLFWGPFCSKYFLQRYCNQSLLFR